MGLFVKVNAVSQAGVLGLLFPITALLTIMLPTNTMLLIIKRKIVDFYFVIILI